MQTESKQKPHQVALKRHGLSKYSPALALKICERLAEGESLRSICRDEGMPSAPTVRGWVVDDVHGFAEQYAHAREIGLDNVAEEILEIADNGANDWMEKNDPENPGYAHNGEHSQRSRLRVDARKWYLSKIAPKKYGDKTSVEMTVNTSLAERLERARIRDANE